MAAKVRIKIAKAGWLMEIKYTKRAVKEISTLNEPLKSRIETGINNLPDGDVKKLEGYATYFRLRVGEFRVIFDWPDEVSIVILSVASRGQAYRRF